MNWSGKRALVTGAGGFIGSHLTEQLVRAGATTRAFVHYNALGTWGWLESSDLRPHIDVVAGDIRDYHSVQSAMQGIDIVFHLAALIAIPYSYEAPGSYVRTNIEGTLNVLQAARACGVQRVVHTSTSEVYGTAHYVPIDEKHPLQGQSPYSATKIGADKLAESFHLSFDLPVVTVRPFNTYGPRQSSRAIIPTLISQCLSHETVQVGNLHPTRDLNYVRDTATGFMAAAASDAAIGKVLNIGSGREISIGDLAQMIILLTGRNVELVIDEQRTRPKKSEVERLLADNRLARTLTGWEPQVTLREGLERTISWVDSNLSAYKTNVYQR